VNTLPRLVITPGEPAGIGPDVCIQLVQQALPASIVFVADRTIVEDRARQLNLPLQIVPCNLGDAIPPHQPGHFPLIQVNVSNRVTAGQLDQDNAAYVLQTLGIAVDMINNRHADALVTGPVHKGIINDAGIAFTGHTEWLAEKTQCALPVMMLATGHLRVALVTTHLPLNQVAQAITADRLESVIRILHQDLINKFHIDRPRIRICGLNPHAGENGHLGMEEAQVIEPVVRNLIQEGMNLQGPVPADTAFIPASLGQTDAILAMYHDQGLPVLKYSGFDDAVNITLGLPIIRTSVDHGTALELAGTGQSNASSMLQAVNMAIAMASKNDG
jgi:4-hydroxythreonine-4-phosphate dehydrogenase